MKKHILKYACLLFIPLAAFSGCSDNEEQEQIIPELSLELPIVDFTAAPTSRIVAVKTNVRDWDFELVKPSDASWLTLSKDGGVKVSASENEAFTPRSAKIIVSAMGLEEELTVNQERRIPMLSVSKATVEFTNEGGDIPLSYGSGTNLALDEWDVEYSEGLDQWLSVVRTERALTLTAKMNKGLERSGTLTIVSQWIDDVPIAVTQLEGGVVKVPLTAASFSSNASDPGEGTDFGLLLDNNLNTYWHSSWRGTPPLPHWLQVDLGKTVTRRYQFYWGTRAGRGPGDIHTPSVFDLLGSTTGGDDESEWFLIRTFTAADDGLPAASGVGYTSPIYSTTREYRYIRIFVNHKSITNNNFWALSEFAYFVEEDEE